MGWGRIGQHRKAGAKGGVGMSGYHKHKWSWTVKYGQDIYGKAGFKRPWDKRTVRVVNLDQVQQIADGLMLDEVDLTKLGYDKLLGRGGLKRRLIINVGSASKSAIEKIKKAGGELKTPV